MKLYPYEMPLTNGQIRRGAFVKLTDDTGKVGWGEIAPLPNRSKETLEDAIQQCMQIQNTTSLFPSVSFGLESALLALLDPLPKHSVPISALLMGSPQQILQQARQKLKEGYTSAKLKISNLSFREAAHLIHQLKDQFHLRLDVNRAWSTADALHFFSQFPLDAFDYVEEPFQNPKDLAQFPHPLAVDESFPDELSLEQLEQLPTLKALIYKPTIQGGLSHCLKIHRWTSQRKIALILSSSFESDLGLAHIASMAYRLGIKESIGIGTYDYLTHYTCKAALQFKSYNSNPLGMQVPAVTIMIPSRIKIP